MHHDKIMHGSLYLQAFLHLLELFSSSYCVLSAKGKGSQAMGSRRVTQQLGPQELA